VLSHFSKALSLRISRGAAAYSGVGNGIPPQISRKIMISKLKWSQTCFTLAQDRQYLAFRKFRLPRRPFLQNSGSLYFQVVGRLGKSIGARMQISLVLDALTTAVWRRKPKDSVIIHSDQGSQFGSDEFNRWCTDNRLSPSMSRRGNCWDNAVAESFFSSLKNEQIKKRIYKTRAEAKSEIFDYIDCFYNRVRRHKHLDQLSPHEFERQRQTAL
jgi:hypothetical protein